MLAIYAFLRPKKAFNPSACLRIPLIFRTNVAEGFEFQTLQNHSARGLILQYAGSVGSVGRYDKKVCWRTDKSRLCAASPCDKFFKARVWKSNPCDCGNAPGAEGFERFEKQTFQPFLR
ncbi:MAG: hypothetical protein SPK03_01360 [Alloprevotella sp.]|nr:hypothetical protein [Alloprevotella sp.]